MAKNGSGSRPRTAATSAIDGELVLQDGELKGNSQLRCRQADARGLVHHAAHEVDEVAEFGVAQLAFERRCHVPEDRMPRLHNRRKDARHPKSPGRSRESGRG